MLETRRDPMTRILYRQNQFPVLQNRVYSSFDEAKSCPKGDIEIVQDLSTGLVYNAAFRPDLMHYDADYNNEQSNSDVFKDHLEWVAKCIETHLGKTQLVEVGCGKGFFLELLLERGFDVTGFDSTYDGDNPRVIKQYFEPGIIASPARGLILRHVLEHIQNPVDFLFLLREANGQQGLIYIEVPCFDWILRKRTWFDIFYEHVNYFRLSDIHRMFGRVIDSGHCFGDQYLYVVADLATLRIPKDNDPYKLDFPADFLAGLTVGKQENSCGDRSAQNVCVWGGASKGVIFSLLRERIGAPVDLVVDINSEKQGKFIPGTGLQVKSPEEALMKLAPGSYIHVMNSNYLEEIKTMSNNLYNYIGADQ
jgi:hypothetical protein